MLLWGLDTFPPTPFSPLAYCGAEVAAEALVPLVEELCRYQHLTPRGTPQ